MRYRAYQELLTETKKYYFSIGKILCPAIDNQYIYFDQHGFRHLLRKGRITRSIPDQIRRMRLFPNAPKIVSLCKKVSAQRHYNRKDSSVTYFLELISNDKKMRVIVRRINNGRPHFFSIMHN